MEQQGQELWLSPDEHEVFLKVVRSKVPPLVKVTDTPMSLEGDEFEVAFAEYDIHNTSVQIIENKLGDDEHYILIRSGRPFEANALTYKESIFRYDVLTQKFYYNEKFPSRENERIPSQATDNELGSNLAIIENIKLKESLGLLYFPPHLYEELATILDQCGPHNRMT